MNRPMGGWLLSHNVTMPDRANGSSFSPSFTSKWEKVSLLIKPPYPPPISPHARPFLFGGLFCSLWNSFMWKRSAWVFFFFMKFHTTIQSFICACLATVRSILRRPLPRLLIAALHLPRLHVTKPTQKHSVKWMKESDSWIFYRRG